ncbi:MAG: PKD domain-containing protein, partial [Gammaproteobacteria bacterium]
MISFVSRRSLTVAVFILLQTACFQQAGAAGPPSGPLSCGISPENATATAGNAVTFTAATQNGKGKISYNWDFTDGSGSPVASTENPVAVTYPATGTFTVWLDVSDKNNDTASCSTSVAVDNGSGSNT